MVKKEVQKPSHDMLVKEEKKMTTDRLELPTVVVG